MYRSVSLRLNLRVQGLTERVIAEAVSLNYFDLLALARREVVSSANRPTALKQHHARGVEPRILAAVR